MDHNNFLNRLDRPGIERDSGPGYAVQEVKGDDLTKARETNIGNALAGRVAGVTVVGNPAGIGSSSRITIRGERSLNINKNQPLFVVDGVPITNEVFGSSGRNNQEVDYGNGAGLVNADDVESLTVLKGASATALYGSVVKWRHHIKTKSGKGAGSRREYQYDSFVRRSLKTARLSNVYGQGLNVNLDLRMATEGCTRWLR